MLIRTAIFTPYGPDIIIALVPPPFTEPEAGGLMLKRLHPFFPVSPIMLVSIQPNGFRAYATFQTSTLLALLQLENLTFTALDIFSPPVKDVDLPF